MCEVAPSGPLPPTVVILGRHLLERGREPVFLMGHGPEESQYAVVCILAMKHLLAVDFSLILLAK